MSIVATLMDRARKGEKMSTDSALALRLGVTRATASQWREGTAYPGEEKIAQLATMAGDHPIDWLIAIKAERSSGAARDAWLQQSRQVVGMVGRVGIEPTTNGLKVRCSTD